MSVRPPQWSGRELDVMRVGLGYVTIVTVARLQLFRPTGKPPHPIGIGRVVGLGWASSRRVVRPLQLLAYAATLFYVAGILVPYALLVLWAALIVDMTFRSSFGSVNHGDHLLAVVVTAQLAGVVVWDAAQHWNWDLGHVLAGSQGATAAWWTVEAILAVYFTSGLAKLINSRGRWIQQSPGLLLASLARVDTDRLMGMQSWGAGKESDGLVTWLLSRPNPARAVFAAGLLVELGSPIGLFGETALLFVGLALLALHRANGRLLGLPFPDYQVLVLVYLVDIPRLFR